MMNFASQIQQLMEKTRNIRNISVIGPLGHGKSTLVDNVITNTRAIGDSLSEERYVGSRKEGSDKQTTNKSIATSLIFHHNEDDVALITDKDQREEGENRFLINLIDTPGHADFSSEVTTAIRVTDGALVIVDCISGVCLQTETVLKQSLRERVKPILLINKLDRALLELQLEPEELYQTFKTTIESINSTIATYAEEEVMRNIRVDPATGSVSFGSGLDGWAFSIKQFADIYSSQFNIPTDKLMPKLWGENYFDKETMEWSSVKTCSNKRTFTIYVLEPIYNVVNAIMNFKTDEIQNLLNMLRINLSLKDQEAEGKDLLKLVMRTWLPASDTVFCIITNHLPSPVTAQMYRADVLYTGPADDVCYKAIRNCDERGPLMMCVSKMVPSSDKGRFYAFGRVFSGRVRSTQNVRILSPNLIHKIKGEIQEHTVPGIVLMLGCRVESVDSVPAGNICGLVGIDQHLVKAGTITTSQDAYHFKAMKFCISPVVRVTVEQHNPSNLPRLIEALERLSKSDPIVECYTEESGELMITGTGEIHLDSCLKDLEADLAGIPLHKSDPFVPYRETVVQESSMICMSKSPNKSNKIYMTACPLPKGLQEDIECGIVSSLADLKIRASNLTSTYDLEASEVNQLWTFGPEWNEANLLIDVTKGVQDLHLVKDFCVKGFQWTTEDGILCGERMHGVQFNLHDIVLHSNPFRRPPGQIIAGTRRTMCASILTAKPRLLEPVFLCKIQCPEAAIGSIHKELERRRSVIIEETLATGGKMHVIKAYLPVIESFGISCDLQGLAKGEAFLQCSFDHWQELPGDPLQLGPQGANNPFNIVTETRKRKGMKPEIPNLSCFLCST